MADAPGNPNVYFTNLPDKELVAAVKERVQKFEDHVYKSGLFDIWSLSYRYWYSQDEEGFTAHRIGKKGPKNKHAYLKFNHYRSIVKNWRSLASSQRARTQPVAKYSGSDADRQVKRAKVVLEHFSKAAILDELKNEAIDICSYMGAAFVEQCWFDDLGTIAMVTEAGGLLPPPELAAPPALPPGPEMPPGEMAPPSELTVEQDGSPVPEEAAPAERKPYGKNGAERTGSIEARCYSPIDVILQPDAMSHRVPWIITRDYMNKWDAAARYAENDEQFAAIIAMSRPTTEKLKLTISFATTDERGQQSDDIPVFKLWHEKRPACPNGYYCVVIGDYVFRRQELPEEMPTIPVKRVAPANIRRTPFGYSEAWDLLAPQKATDILRSIAFSNARTYGAGNILSPKGSGLKSTAITEGLNLLEYNVLPGSQIPTALAVPQTPPEVYSSLKTSVNEMGTLIGVNSVARGDPEKSLESGSALAIVQAQAVQFSSDFQLEIVTFEGLVDTDTIVITQCFLKVEFEFAVVGAMVATLDKFAGEGVKGIMRVDVEPVNPMTKTIGGRVQMATMLAQTYPQQVTPQQMIHMLTNGTLDPITEDVESEVRNIQRENEMMLRGIGAVPKTPVLGPDGQPVIDPMTGQPQMARQKQPGVEYVRALLMDNPYEHVKKHKALLDSPAARNDEKIYAAVLSHVEEHEEQYAFLTTDRPGLLQILQLPPMQAALPPPMPGEDGAGPPGGGDPKAKGGGVRPPAPGPEHEDTPPDGAGAAKMPNFPKNPTTGERYQPPAPPGG